MNEKKERKKNKKSEYKEKIIRRRKEKIYEYV
jgi:hypothetical protein